jgi:tetratricopeptide (TPR) repeat protein
MVGMRSTLIYFFLIAVLFSCKESQVPTSMQSLVVQNYHESIRLYIKGDYEKSLESSEKVLIEDPNHDAAHYLKSQIYMAVGKLDEASASLLLAGKADPKNTYLASEIAYMYSERGQFEKAAAQFEALILKFPSESIYYSGAYLNYSKAENHGKALSTLKKEEQVLGASPENSFNFYKTYLAWKKPKEAISALEKGMSLFPTEPLFLANLVDFYLQNNQIDKAIPLLDNLCIVDPENGLAKFLYGDYLINSGKTEKGEKLLGDCLFLNGPTLQQKFDILLSFQNKYGCTHSNKDRLVSFTQAYPNEALSFSMLGDLFVVCKEPKKAIEQYEKSLLLKPNAYPVWQQILFLLYQEELWDLLLAKSQSCVQSFPNQPFPYLTQAISLNKKSRYIDAEALSDMGLTLCVNQNNISSELTFQKAISRFNTGPTQEPLVLFHESLALQPNNLALKADAANEVLSNALFVTFADSLIEQCLKAEPKNAKFVAIKGRVLYTRNETLQAVKWIAEAMELGYPAKLGEEWLGDCYEKLGDKTKAKGSWNKAKAAGNDSERLKLKLLH